MMLKRVFGVISVTALLAATGAYAQTYPARPVTMVGKKAGTYAD